jgi:NADPH:quinone reductase-like Zn-dependent oxidoreductase
LSGLPTKKSETFEPPPRIYLQEEEPLYFGPTETRRGRSISMKAAVYTTDPPDVVVQIEDVERPVPKDNEVLIKVRAASVNPLDAGLMKGKPHSFRILFGLRKPRLTRPGVDVAGQVEAAGKSVMQFKPGDEVFGICKGAFAEYVCAPESGLAIKPENLTFELGPSIARSVFLT